MSKIKTVAQRAKIDSQILFTEAQAVSLTEKKCSRCNKVKPVSEYHKNSKHSSSVKSQCKSCSASDFKSWRERNLEEARLRDRISHYIRTYNLSKEKAMELVEDRDGVCEICKSTAPLVVDHCHTEGHVRGFICSSCNSALGYAKDNIDTLLACIEYLKNDKDRKDKDED